MPHTVCNVDDCGYWKIYKKILEHRQHLDQSCKLPKFENLIMFKFTASVKGVSNFGFRVSKLERHFCDVYLNNIPLWKPQYSHTIKSFWGVYMQWRQKYFTERRGAEDKKEITSVGSSVPLCSTYSDAHTAALLPFKILLWFDFEDGHFSFLGKKWQRKLQIHREP